MWCDIMNKKILNVVVGIILLVSIILCVLFFSKSNKITSLEEIKIKEVSENRALYLDNLNGNYKEDYLAYALDYIKNEKELNEVSIDELIKVITNTFNVSTNEEEIAKIGITPAIMEKGIVFDYNKKVFILNSHKKSLKDIAATPVYYYVIDKIEKKNNDIFVVKYTKLETLNPYDVLNKYDGNDEALKNINSYLKGESGANLIKKYMNRDTSNAIGELVVTYKVVNGNVLIDSIR